MFGRIDLEKKYGGALKSCKNFIPRPQGGLISRTGSTYLGDTGLDGGTSLLVEFHPNEDFSFCLEFSDQALRAIPSGHVIDGSANPIVTISGSTYLESELPDLRWDYENDSMIFTHPNHEPKRLRFNGMSESPIFDFANLEFTTHPLQKKDTSDMSIRAVEDTHFMKVISSSATEFNSIGNAEYIEFKFDGQWQLAKLAGFTSWGDTFKDGTNVPDPSGSVAYIKPVSKMVKDLNKASKTVVVNKEYLFDTTPDPNNTNTFDGVVTRTYPDLTPASQDYWWLRADAQVFTEEMVGAWVRFRSDYNKVLNSEKYADNGIRWGRIVRRVGLEPHSTEYLVAPDRGQILEGHTYQVIRAGAGFQFTSGCPIESPSKLKWELAFVYTKEGESFQPTTDWWFDNTNKGYTSAGTHPSGTTVDFFSPSPNPTILEHQDTRVTFDVVILDELIGDPVGDDSYNSKLMTLSGEITLTKEDATYGDQLGHLGHIRSPEDFFYDASTNPTGVRVGQYILARHNKDFVTYKVDTVTSTKEAQVTVVDGDLPKDIDTDEIYDEGRTDNFRISAWWTGNWPYTVAYHESRIFFGGSPEFPQYLWGSKLEDEFDFRTVENDGKVLDTTGLAYPIKGKSFDRINWLDSGQVLNIGTQNAEWQMRPNQFQSPITAVNLRILEQTQNGATLPPIKVNGILIFPNATGKRLVEYYFDFQQDKHVSRDLSVFADHLLFKDPIVDICYQENPFEVIWMVTESGALYSLTYNRDQGVYAWAKHETEGRYKQCATFRSTTSTYGHDRVIFHVERDLPSGTKTYLEVADPLLTLYQDPIKKIGLTTMDSVARIWSSTIDNGEGSPGDPNEGGGNTPGIPGFFLTIPSYSDAWNWVLIDWSLANPLASSEANLSSGNFYNGLSGSASYPGAPYNNDFDWATDSNPNAEFEMWGVEGGIVGGAGHIAPNPPEVADYWVLDTRYDHLLTDWGFSFASNNNTGTEQEKGIYQLKLYGAKDSNEDGVAYSDKTLSWDLIQTYNMEDDGDWTGWLNGQTKRIDKTVDPSNQGAYRYYRFQITDNYANHSATDPNLSIRKIDLKITPSGNEIEATVERTVDRYDSYHTEFEEIDQLDGSTWGTRWIATPSTGSVLTGDLSQVLNRYSNSAVSPALDNTHHTWEFLCSSDYPEAYRYMSQLLFIGSAINGDDQPTNLKVWYQHWDDTDWVFYRHFRMPNFSTTGYYGGKGDDLANWQQYQYGTSNSANKAFSMPVPQGWFRGLKFEFWNEIGDTGYGSAQWHLSNLYYLSRISKADGVPSNPLL
jgi:hypothetical protein